MSNTSRNHLSELKLAIKNLILKNYPTVEQFCWDKDLNKATLSNFFNNKGDPKLSTLVKIVEALGKDLIISMR